MYHEMIEQVRLHHILQCFSSLYYGLPSSTWQGDISEGCYSFSNGQGDEIGIAWNSTGLVALVFDHEFPNERGISKEKRQPLIRLWNIPEYLKPLGEKAANLLDRLVTHGLWANKIRLGASDRWGRSSRGIDMLHGFTIPPESAVFGDELLQNWLESSSLSEPLARLAMRLAKHSTAVSKEDEAILLSPPEGAELPMAKNAKASAKKLAEIGLRWKVPVASLERTATSAVAVQRKSVVDSIGQINVDLFEAARNDDADLVKSLLLRGADKDCRTLLDQWEATPAGDTPLIQAIKQNAYRAARVMIAAGADLDAVNSFGQTAILWAARSGDASLIQLLLDSGANPNIVGHTLESPLHNAALGGNFEVAKILLNSGADSSLRRYGQSTAAELARQNGHAQVFQLLDNSQKD